MIRLSHSASPVTRNAMFARVIALFALFAILAGGIVTPSAAALGELGAVEHAIDHHSAVHDDAEQSDSSQDGSDTADHAAAHHHCSADVAPALSAVITPTPHKSRGLRPVASAPMASRTVAPPTEPPAV